MKQFFSINTWIGLAMLLLFPVLGFSQGVTTAVMNGQITSADGQPLVGATVIAKHTPSGSTYGNLTNEEGYFRIPNMRVGGPYSVSVSYVGYSNNEQTGIYLSLGQTYQLSVSLAENTITTGEVVISSSRSDIFDGNRTGAETNITEGQINALPTVSRAIGDFARLTPQATVSEGNDGFSISIAGQNNRYNAIYLDGAVNNDVFGLAGSGTNGGQTGVSPISLDAIESFQIQVAPFDVRVGGFAGGAINAVTRSGSNNIEASVYTFYRNQNTAGLTPDRDGWNDTPDGSTQTVKDFYETTYGDSARQTYRNDNRLADFTAQTTGFRVGGPIIKDKLFFFVNGEIQREETPLPVSGTYAGNSSAEDLERLRNFIDVEQGYDPGTYDDARQFLNSEKVTVKFDYNISQNHKLSLRHGYVRAENLEGVNSSSSRIRFLNESEYFVSTTNSTALELNSTFGNTMSNNLKVGVTIVRDDRDPYQGEDFKDRSEDENPNYFPYVTIQDGGGRITFGSERFSTANALNQNVITLTDNFEIYKGRHTITLGTHNEFYQVYNLFIRENFGVYEFANLDDYLNGGIPTEFSRTYSAVDNITGDGSAAASEFNGAQFGLYAQDEFQISNTFKLTGGLRLDIPVYFTDQPVNEDFNTNTIPDLESAGYDLMGAQTGQFISPQLLLSPRIGFNWDVTGNKTTQIRGGVGIFTSRIPLVWPGGAFNNNGATLGGDETDTTQSGWFRPYSNELVTEWDNQPQGVEPGAGEPSGQIDLFADNFKVPRILKANLSVDQKLPWGVVANFDVLFNKTLQAVTYQNLNIRPSTETLTGTGDNRALFDRGNPVDPTYTGIYLASNTSEGYTYNISVSLSKSFAAGLSGQISYAYGDAFSVFDGTSSQNSSQWRGLHAINGRNFDQQLARSDFSQGHRVIAGLSYKFNWNEAKNAATTISFFYEGVSGTPYSYIYSNGASIQNEDSRQRTLIYVPADQNDIILADAADWAALDAFIEADDYLSTRRGMYAERNSNRGPSSNVIDLRLVQDLTINAGGKSHTLQLTADIFNFTNLLNKNWGRRYFIPNSFEGFSLLNFVEFEDGTNNPVFSLNNIPEDFPNTDLDDSGIQSSRWQMQLGVRYLFK